MEEKHEKNIFILKKITFEQGTAISQNLEQDTLHGQPIC